MTYNIIAATKRLAASTPITAAEHTDAGQALELCTKLFGAYSRKYKNGIEDRIEWRGGIFEGELVLTNDEDLQHNLSLVGEITLPVVELYDQVPDNIELWAKNFRDFKSQLAKEIKPAVKAAQKIQTKLEKDVKALQEFASLISHL